MSKSAPQGNHRAVVLGGGGSKGAYQIGVWQALRELGLDYRVVTGTSVGALNGALMAQGEFEAAYALWWEMDNARVMEGIPSAGDTLDSRLAVYRAFVREMVTKGGLDISPLEATIRDILDEEKLRQSGVEYGIVTVDMSTLKPVELFLRDMPPGSVADYMIASASCFPAFKPRTIEKARFIDGGYYDNLPVGMATRAGVALSEIWAVDVDGIGVKRSFRPEVPLHTVRSCWDLGNFLIFEKDQCRRNIRLGYLDAMKEAGRYDGRAYAFPAGEGDVFRRARGPAMVELTRRVLEPLEEPARAAVEALALARVRGKLRRRRLGEDLLLAAAETAGELLGLDPTRVYTMAELDDALRERVRLERDRQGGQELTLDTLPGEGGSLAEALAALGKELALLSVLENLAQYLAGEAPILRPGLLAAALPREFLACLYLIVAL
ncbi:MAG: patatin-like phospholipase family protein [Angelakisella sp.]|jgi:NTE family protein|nr:patatin-like phospholipase family protein [Angelakisella sp.]